MKQLFPASRTTMDLGMGKSWSQFTGGLTDKLLILGAIGVLTLLLVVWAVYFRKRSRRRRSRHDYPRSQSSQRTAQVSRSSDGQRRRRRRRHRPRNPTRAETGGLPPLRSQEPQETTA